MKRIGKKCIFKRTDFIIKNMAVFGTVNYFSAAKVGNNRLTSTLTLITLSLMLRSYGILPDRVKTALL